MEDFLGGKLIFLFELRKPEDVFKNKSSVVELLYDHLSPFFFKFLKVSNIYQNMHLDSYSPPNPPLESPPKPSI
jgi:hypothetical protein